MILVIKLIEMTWRGECVYEETISPHDDMPPGNQRSKRLRLLCNLPHHKRYPALIYDLALRLNSPNQHLRNDIQVGAYRVPGAA